MKRLVFVIYILVVTSGCQGTDSVNTTCYTRQSVVDFEYQKGLYSGEICDGLPVGMGVITYHNGTVRKGLYVNGYLQGEVSTVYAGKASTIGQFVDGKEHGRFEVTMSTGKVYEVFYRDGVKVEGISSTDMYTGYVGERNDIGQKHGLGKGVFYSGDTYLGEWKFGAPYGYGLLVWKNSRSFYLGDSAKGISQGQGTKFIEGDSKYIGEWKNGREEGQGIRYYIGGDRPKEWVGCFHTGRFWRGIAKGELDCSKNDDKAFWDNLKNTKPDLSKLERLYPDYDWANE